MRSCRCSRRLTAVERRSCHSGPHTNNGVPESTRRLISEGVCARHVSAAALSQSYSPPPTLLVLLKCNPDDLLKCQRWTCTRVQRSLTSGANLHGRVAGSRLERWNAAPLITLSVYLLFSVPINIIWYPPMIKQTPAVTGKQNQRKGPSQQQ